MAARKSWLPLLAALLMGVAAAAIARNWIKDRIDAVEARQRNGVPVVVATREIPFGERILEADVMVISWPHDHVPQGVFGDAAEVVGKIANQRIVVNEPILRARSVQLGGGSSLAALIEPNKRAVTVRVNDVIGVAGFLLPGNRVDVLATRMLDQQRQARTRTLLSNVKVLAVDQTAVAEKDQPVVVRAVTLQVEPLEAERLVQATEEGTVQLALRNPDDRGQFTAEEEVSVASPPPAIAIPATVPRKASSPNVPPPVTVIRQTQVGKQPD